MSTKLHEQDSRMTDPAPAFSPRRRRSLLVFVHIPKTAGTTLRHVLSLNEPGMRSRALANVFKGGGGLSKTLVERMRDGTGPQIDPEVNVVRGHFPLGIREYLPKHLPKQRELACFTFLREPIDRTLSHFYPIRELRAGEEKRGRYSRAPLPADATLDDALAAGYVHDNLQTRMLCGDPAPFGEVTEEMLEQAKANLSTNLAFFGLTERFDESLVLAKRKLGLRVILYRSSGRVNSDRPRGKQVPDELRREAEHANRYDIELYRYAKELFERELEQPDLEFEAELAALRAAKEEGELEVKAPVPAGFGGDQEAWRLLVRATATAQRLEWDLAWVANRAAAGTRGGTQSQEPQGDDTQSPRLLELEREGARKRAPGQRRPRTKRQGKERRRKVRRTDA
jgi:Sulfotransferase family